MTSQGYTDPLADPDHDGIFNLVEYALSTNPNAPGDRKSVV